ncbi:excinuclease ABC subunit UvrB [bacterium]|nr:excinuclease ABC subunit UvrB [bacterium]
MALFSLTAQFTPQGDQIKAIDKLVRYVKGGASHCVLLGVTGSGKTFTLANLIKEIQRPALVISHNKTLAAQLYSEFKAFFPDNAVEYFVSYYDYYQPEAYIPQTDTYIEKDSSINEDIDRMRHSATRSLLSRSDVIVVASVSCIYGLGSPDEYMKMSLVIGKGQIIDRRRILKELVRMQYARNDFEFKRGNFRVRGDVIEIFPAYENDGVLISLFGDEIEGLYYIDPLRGIKKRELDRIVIYPNSHYVLPKEKTIKAIKGIREELKDRLVVLNADGRFLEAQRLEQRILYDIEMMEEIGYCHGIENYSRHLDGRESGEPPHTLLDYYPSDAIVIIDESHVTCPQLRGMLEGDRSRKNSLVEFGFRLPSAYDNRPLSFDEFCHKVNQLVFVSATPGSYELQTAEGRVIEQIIRPTGLMDPEIIVRPASNQVDGLLSEIRIRVDRNERVLVTTLTKKMAEDLSEYYHGLDIKVRYLHSEIDTIERTEILRDLRLGVFDCLIGVNLLREGLDLPEVSLVAIMDADKEGFLRSATSLIQTAGRAARNVNGQVIMYADQMTYSMQKAIEETNRRRQIQMIYNRQHNITPESIKKSITDLLQTVYEKDYYTPSLIKDEGGSYKIAGISGISNEAYLEKLREKMERYARELRFEEAAMIRDEIEKIRD